MNEWDVAALVNSRFETLEARVTAIEASREDVIVLKTEVRQMTDAFNSLRMALYSTSVLIIGAAVLVLLLGK